MLSARGALGGGPGKYQLTRDGEKLVWNSHPKRGDEASWSGERDREGYAHGFGTLTWYTREQSDGEPVLYARYWGNMEQGKLNGAVNLHVRKKTSHAIFAGGVRLTRWAKGTAPTRIPSKFRAAIAKQNAVSEPESPAAGPGTGRVP